MKYIIGELYAGTTDETSGIVAEYRGISTVIDIGLDDLDHLYCCDVVLYNGTGRAKKDTLPLLQFRKLFARKVYA